MYVMGNKEDSILRSSLFLFLTVLLNITFLKMGFIVVQWENKSSVRVLNVKKVIGTVELKDGTAVDISTLVWPFIQL